ncbi:MAG: hypothetical protein R3F03_06185 [Opitutaceae bacterium]
MNEENRERFIQKLNKVEMNPRFSGLCKADRLTLIACLLYQLDPVTFNKLNHLTWPTGQAILLSDDKQLVERTNPSAQVRLVVKTPYYLDVGHDNAAMQRLVEMLMLPFGLSRTLVNRCKGLFVVNRPWEMPTCGQYDLFA